MKFKAVVFDLFGTMIYRRVKTNFVKDLGFPKNSKSIVLSGNYPTVKAMCERFNITPEKEVLEQAEGFVKSELENICEMFDATRAIEFAKAQGYKVFALSNIGTPWAEAFKKMPIAQKFDDLFLSCETGNVKPTENSYRDILKKYNLNPWEVLIIGDTPEADIYGPWENGIKGVFRGQDIIEAIKKAETDYDWKNDTLTLNGDLIFKIVAESSDTVVGYDYRFNRQYKFKNKVVARYAFESSIDDDRTFLQKYDAGVMDEVNL